MCEEDHSDPHLSPYAEPASQPLDTVMMRDLQTPDFIPKKQRKKLCAKGADLKCIMMQLLLQDAASE